MSSEIKLRNLVSDPIQEEVCLKDLIFKLTDCSRSVSILEHKNTKTALDNVKRELTEFEKLFIQFKQRIRGKVTYEVMDAVSKDTKVYGNPDKLREFNEKRKKSLE
jgi:hypothetical protein